MPAQPVMTSDQPLQASTALLHELFGRYHPRDFAVRFWDGTTWDPDPGQPARFTLVLNHPGALRNMFRPLGEATLAEAYIYGDFDIQGDIEAALPLADHLLTRPWRLKDRIRYGKYLSRLPVLKRPRTGRQAARLSGALSSKERARQAVTYHYDVSNDFFALFLDKRMIYTCAYFTSADDDLETAQERKLDYICRKLRLAPGQRLLDIGCGWGALIIHAAGRYGVDALGVTLSRPQAELAQARIAQAGLSDRCRVEVCDYRDIKGSAQYDRLVSIGMFEHLRKFMLPEYFGQAWQLLRPSGVFLNHGISWAPTAPAYIGPTYNDRYAFPDSEVLPISTVLAAAENAGFEVRDLESLREHYLLTTRHWLRRFEAHRDEIVRVTDEPTYRIWRLGLGGVAYRFKMGRLNLYQALLVKPDGGKSGLPLTRADWYQPAPWSR